MQEGITYKKYNMPLTLEMHFEDLASRYDSVKELLSLWVLLKKKLEEELSNSKNVFVNFSLHDSSHSRSILHAIERFLGERRIELLSATDTFMLLVCAYTHDYGMAQAYNKIYNILGSDEFKKFLQDTGQRLESLENEDATAVQNLLEYLNDNKKILSLQEMYYSIMLAIQLYIRPMHWKGVIGIRQEFECVFYGHIKERFFGGTEGIIELCMCHGQTMKELLALPQYADGIVGDDYHPRFVAAMLRLGDLLDLDNGRFPSWFVREVQKEDSIIPKLSKLHYRKHEAISHLLITDKKIEITARCDSEKDGYEVAEVVSDWTNWLEEECGQMVAHWNDIAQPDFGAPPSNIEIKIYVNGMPYTTSDKKMQMQMSQERVMKLLEGTSIYRNQYVGIREIIQNAVDASLIQMWNDIVQHRYLSYGLDKDVVKNGLDILDMFKGNRHEIFGKYDILVEVIKDESVDPKRVYVVVKDKGVGITPKEIQYIADIGSSKEKNQRIKDMMYGMPKWMKPAGLFGIGLQSVFQLTDCIEFYTRQHNFPERQIMLYSYGKNKSRIEIRDIKPNVDGLYYDNAIPGTNVKIAIEPRKLWGKKDKLLYYDLEFDDGDELNVIYAELCSVVEGIIKETRSDYFNIFFDRLVKESEKKVIKSGKKCLRRSFFTKPAYNKDFEYVEQPTAKIETFANLGKNFGIIENEVIYWDRETQRFYQLKIRPCILDNNKVFLPSESSDLYHISYKFNKLVDVESIYSEEKREEGKHAGLIDCSVIILDDDTTKYVNIDRERLRENAVSEKELEEVQKRIIKLWCEEIVATMKKKKTLKKDRLKNSKETEKESSSKEKSFFDNHQGLYASYILLFYQNVERKLFDEYMDIYKDWIAEKSWYLGNTDIMLEDLWDNVAIFYTEVESGFEANNIIVNKEEKSIEKVRKRDKEKKLGVRKKLPFSVVRKLPKGLISIDSIYFQENKICYYFRIGKSESNVINLDEQTKLHDYMRVFDSYEEPKGKIKLDTMLKKVFKPNVQYKNLVVSRYPHTFTKGNNYKYELESYISSYILSPFDFMSYRILKNQIDNEKDVEKEFIDHVMESRQLEKCINYILKNQNVSKADYVDAKERVRDEYEKFIIDFFQYISKNRDIVKSQYK